MNNTDEDVKSSDRPRDSEPGADESGSRRRSSPGLAAVAVVGVAIGAGVGIYHEELRGLSGTLFGAAATNAQEAEIIVPSERPGDVTQNDQASSEVSQASDLNGNGSQAEAADTTGRVGANPFEQHIEQSGIRTCSALYTALGGSLTGGSSYGVQSFWNEENPNANAVEGIVGLDYRSEGYTGPAAGYVSPAPMDPVATGRWSASPRSRPRAASCRTFFRKGALAWMIWARSPPIS